MFEHYDGRNRGSVDQHLLCLYLITLNGKKYVGQTNCTSRRFSQHKNSTSGCRYIRNAIKAYGWENAKVEILLVDLTLKEANRLETHYIDILGTLSPSGYNLKKGGDNNEWSEDSKQKMSDTMKLKCENPEIRKAFSVSAKKRFENPEYIEAMSVRAKNKWEDPEYREAVSESVKKNWRNPEYRALVKESVKKRWDTAGVRENHQDSKKHLRKFTDEELIEMNDKFEGSNDKLSAHFECSKAVVKKYKKRLGLERKYYKRKFTDEELIKTNGEFRGSNDKLSK